MRDDKKKKQKAGASGIATERPNTSKCLTSVVFPAPRKPFRTVTGMRVSLLLDFEFSESDIVFLFLSGIPMGACARVRMWAQ